MILDSSCTGTVDAQLTVSWLWGPKGLLWAPLWFMEPADNQLTINRIGTTPGQPLPANQLIRIARAWISRWYQSCLKSTDHGLLKAWILVGSQPIDIRCGPPQESSPRLCMESYLVLFAESKSKSSDIDYSCKHLSIFGFQNLAFSKLLIIPNVLQVFVFWPEIYLYAQHMLVNLNYGMKLWAMLSLLVSLW